MKKENHGNSWTAKDEGRLETMLYDGASYDEMAKELGRSWFACKCRLIKLKLIPFESQARKTNVEKYDVPLRYVNRVVVEQKPAITFQFDEYEEDTSRTFSNAELNIIEDYFKTRLAKLAIQKLGVSIYATQIEIARLEEIFTDEISKVNIAKKMSVAERERQLTRIA